MGHHVQAFIGERPILELIQRQFQVSQVIDLKQRLALLPLLDELYDAIPDEPSGVTEPKFKFLTPKIIALLKQNSVSGVIGYFETDYAGGTGDQGAVLARLGEIIVGPRTGPGSINQMLAGLGVNAFAAVDEFDAVDLGRFRENADWIDQPSFSEKKEDPTLTGNFIAWIHKLGKK